MNKNKITIIGASVLLSLSIVNAQNMMASSTKPMPKIMPTQIPMILIEGMTGDTVVDAKIAVLRKEYRDKMKAMMDDYQAKVKAVAGDLKFKNKESIMMMGKKDEARDTGGDERGGKMYGTTSVRGVNRNGPNPIMQGGTLRREDEMFQNQNDGSKKINMQNGAEVMQNNTDIETPKKQRRNERIPVKITPEETGMGDTIRSWFGGGN